MYVGIDLGQRRVHVVALDDELRIVAARVVDVADLESLRDVLASAQVVAVDAPEALSTAPHAEDETLPPKFRTARCAEIALGREHAIWFPWVTPTTEQPLSPWMRVGFDVFAAPIAYQAAAGTTSRVGCGHDDSAIFLPAAVGSPAGGRDLAGVKPVRSLSLAGAATLGQARPRLLLLSIRRLRWVLLIFAGRTPASVFDSH